MRGMNRHGLIVPLRIVGAMMLIASVMPGGLALWYYSTTRAFLDTAIVTEGTVVELLPRGAGGFSAAYEYRDQKGMVRRKIARASPRAGLDAVGKKFRVYYSPTEPDDAWVDDFLAIWFVPMICGFFTLAALPTGVVLIWAMPWWIRRVADARPAGR